MKNDVLVVETEAMYFFSPVITWIFLPGVKTVTVPDDVSVFDTRVPAGVSALVSLFTSRVAPTCWSLAGGGLDGSL